MGQFKQHYQLPRLFGGCPELSLEHYRLWDSDPTLLQSALARGYRWLQMLESGQTGSLEEIAQKFGYVVHEYLLMLVEEKLYLYALFKRNSR